MKMTSGVMHDLSGTDTGRGQPAVGRALRQGLPVARPAAGRRHGRRLGPAGTRAVLAVAASMVLIGCAAVPADPWRVEPLFRVQNGGANAAQGYLALAKQYEGEGRSAQALDAYRKAARAAPADPDVLNALGQALARSAQYGPAVTALRQAVALAPERAPLLNNLGYALLLDGRSEDARAIFRLALAVQPTHAMALRNLAHVDQQLAAAAAPRPVPPAAVAQPAPVQPAPVEPVAVLPAAVLPAAVLPAAVLPVAALPVALLPVAATPVAVVVAAPAPVQAAPAPAPQAAAGIAAPGPATPSAGSAPEVRAAAQAPRSLDGVSVEIVNGNGINGAAARMRQLLRKRGVEVGRLANRLPYDSPYTQVLYRAGKAAAALEMAKRLPVGAAVGPAPAGSTRADISVLLGHDVRRSAGCAVLDACAAGPEPLASTGGVQASEAGSRVSAQRW